jgi:methyl coenzyme M reductase subunit C-like uncharacterized protein (methanogenesis marker protein 7)
MKKRECPEIVNKVSIQFMVAAAAIASAAELMDSICDDIEKKGTSNKIPNVVGLIRGAAAALEKASRMSRLMFGEHDGGAQ